MDFLPQDLRIKALHPQGTQTLFGCGEHHIRGDDRRIDFVDAVAVKAAHPAVRGVRADHEDCLCCIGVGVVHRLRHLRQTLRGLYDQDALGLVVLAGGRQSACLQDCLEMLRRNGLVRIGTDGAAFFCEFRKIHRDLSFLVIWRRWCVSPCQLKLTSPISRGT